MIVIGLRILLAASAAVLSGWNFFGVSDMNTNYTENEANKRLKEDKMNKFRIAFGMYMGLPDGKEFKSMEARYVRKK